MLVLTRKIGEEILIGDDIRITCLSIHGNQVRLGIEAPRSVPLFRQELIARGDKGKTTANKENNPVACCVGK